MAPGGIQHPMEDDRALVNAVTARIPGAFERLVARHQKLVWHLVYRMVGHPEDARELCQDVFFRVHERLHQYRFESALSTWVGRVAFSVATRHLQKKKLPMVARDDGDDDAWALNQVSDGFDLEAAASDHELMQALNSAIEALPPLQRTLVTLYRKARSRITCSGRAANCAVPSKNAWESRHEPTIE